MSMSQEEIEALMNGIDIADGGDDVPQDEVIESTDTVVDTQEIEDLISQSQNIDVNKNDTTSELEELNNVASSQEVSSEDIDELLKDIDTQIEIPTENNETIEENFVEEFKEDTSLKNEEEKVEEEISHKIDDGIFPLPANNDSKVVSQLSQVANDSEEKGSQIFDVLSFVLDSNMTLRNNLKDIDSFTNNQIDLLNSLNGKFPNIGIFKEYSTDSSKVLESLGNIKGDLDAQDSQIFQAMELMQFNDINRQKIERVMSVIRKLTLYLNNLFEDDNASQEIAVAKHIHGDDTEDLIEGDLDKLIDEFANKD